MITVTPHGDMDDDAVPTAKDREWIISELTRNDDDGREFRKLTEYAMSAEVKTVREFREGCEAFLIGYRKPIEVLRLLFLSR